MHSMRGTILSMLDGSRTIFLSIYWICGSNTLCSASSAHQWEIFGGRNFRGNKFSRAGIWSWKSRKLLPRGNFPLYGICNCVSNSWNVPSLKLSPNFCIVLLVIFRYMAGTCVSTILACSDFTSSSWLHSEGFSNQAKPNCHCLNSASLQDVSHWINTTTWMNLDDW